MVSRSLGLLLPYHRAALAFLHPVPLSLSLSIGLLLVHAIGLMLVAQLARVPWWLVGVPLVGLVVIQVVPRLRKIPVPAILAPFWFVYLLTAIRFVWLRVGSGEIGGYYEYLLPDLRVLLRFEFFAAAALAYSALIFSVLFSRSRVKGLLVGVGLTAGAALFWAIVEYFGHRTYGAAGSDPFAYVQMGIDLMTRGTAAHRFDLFPLIASDKIPWFPIVHVGYHLPFDLQGDAVTVWSLGGALVYGLAYRIAGESALYLVNPTFSVLGILVSGLLVWELLRNQPLWVRSATSGAAASLIATSNEVVNWAGVTMVDTQALVFSTLAIYCSLRVYRTGKLGWAVAAGICWGMAYFVRHTQLVLVLGMLPLLLAGRVTTQTRLRNLVVVGAGALLMALPDLWYHQTYLGSWLTPESEELALFSSAAIPGTLGALAQSVFIGSEFGWLTPFLPVGIFLYARRDRVPTAALLLWFGATLTVHLPYPALRLRDLLPEFPIVAFYAAYGVVAGIGAMLQAKRRWVQAVATAVLFLALEACLIRVWNTVPRVVGAPLARFGAMTQAQRVSFDTLARLMPQNAIVGASLNSGAIELYAHRKTFRPADWCHEGNCSDLREFLAAAQRGNYEIYLLQDNASLDTVLQDLQSDHRVEQVATLDVPLFGDKEIPIAGALWKITP